MCNEAVHDSLVVLIFIPDRFLLISKMIKTIFTVWYDGGLRLLDEDSGDVTSFVMKWAFLVYIVIILILVIILMKMILILSFLSDFWLGIVSLKNGNHLKRSVRN